jgi:hypothetical protein
VRAPGFAPAVVDRSGREPFEVRMVPSTVAVHGRVLVDGAPVKARTNLQYFLRPGGGAEWPDDGPILGVPPGALRVVEFSLDTESFGFQDLPEGYGWLTTEPWFEDQLSTGVPGRRVALRGDQTLELRAEPPSTVALDLQLPRTFPTHPPPEVEVWFHRTGGASARWDGRLGRPLGADGEQYRFRLNEAVGERRYDLFVEAIYAANTAQDRRFYGKLAGSRLDSTNRAPSLVLAEPKPLQGVVVDVAGNPAAEALVTVVPDDVEAFPDGWHSTESFMWRVTTDAKGRFRQRLPPFGVVHVSAETGDAASIPIRTPADAQNLSLIVAPRARATGRVTTSLGSRPPKYTLVRACTDDGQELGAAFASEDGQFSVQWPAPQAVRLVVELRGGWLNECLVTRPLAGSASNLQLFLGPGTAREGVVVDAKGRPVPNADVSAHGRWSDQHTRTDQDGRWRFDGLCDREIDVTVVARDGSRAHGQTRGDPELRLVLGGR